MASWSPPAGWTRNVSSRTGAAYFFNRETGEALWESAALPAGWAVATAAKGASTRQYVHLASGKRQDVPPSGGGVAAAVKRPRSDGGGGDGGGESGGTGSAQGAKPAKRAPPAVAAELPFARLPEDTPKLAAFREAQLSAIRGELAAVAAKMGPMNRATKTAWSVHRDGYLIGLHGLFARFQFRHLNDPEQVGLKAGATVWDPLIPVNPPFDSHTQSEFVQAGLHAERGAAIVESLRAGCSKAARLVHAERARAFATGAAVATPRKSQLGGKVRLECQGESVNLNPGHFAKLQRLYAMVGRRYNDASSKQELLRIFNLVVRYESLASSASGYQGAVPNHVLQCMHDTFGVAHECFASPLNCHFPSFCSLFPDTDRFFGSKGNFFNYRPIEGSFESNPPFEEDVMTANVIHIERLLASSARPLSFIIVVPAWDDDKCTSYQRTVASKFLRYKVRLSAKDHQYKDGLQWRSDRIVWDANVDSFLFWMQNDAGAAKWPATDVTVGKVLAAFRTRTE